MGLNARITDYCQEIYQIYSQNSKVISRASINAVILGILFFACKNNEAPRTIKELAKETHTTQDEVRRGMKLVSKRCASLINTAGSDVTVHSLIERYCTKLDLEYSFTSKALGVETVIHKYAEGRHMNTIAAVSIVIALSKFKDLRFVASTVSLSFAAVVMASHRVVLSDSKKIDDETVARVAGLTHNTLRKFVPLKTNCVFFIMANLSFNFVFGPTSSTMSDVVTKLNSNPSSQEKFMEVFKTAPRPEEEEAEALTPPAEEAVHEARHETPHEEQGHEEEQEQEQEQEEAVQQ